MRILRAVVLALCLVLVPSVAFADGEDTDDPPLIMDGTLTPNTVDYHGGDVVIAATVTDDVGIDNVYADVVLEDGSNTSWVVPMTSSGGSTTYSGTFTVPQNFTTDTPSYAVAIWATDTIGQGNGYANGEIYQTAQPEFDEPPVVSDPQVSPRTLTAAGGAVTISANASDNRSVSEVHAVVTLPGGSMTDVTLDPDSSTHFVGTFNAPANSTTTAQQYAVSVVATDDIGQQDSESAGTFSVAKRATPAPGVLAISPSRVAFGNVRTGTTARRSVLVSNTGQRNSSPVTFVVRAPSSPFSLARGTRTVTLRPGQSLSLSIGFKPTSVGAKSGQVRLQRTDGRQPGLSIALTGRGVKPPKRH